MDESLTTLHSAFAGGRKLEDSPYVIPMIVIVYISLVGDVKVAVGAQG